MAITLQEYLKILHCESTNAKKCKYVNEITEMLMQNQFSKDEIEVFLKSNILESEKYVKILYVNFIRQSQNEETFINILRTEDDQLVSDVIRKCHYFYKLEKYTPQFYSNEIFPYISIVFQKLLISQLASNLNTERAEAFFNYFNTNHGILLSRPFFIHCSEKFILEKLKSRSIIANSRELEFFMSKNRKFVLDYLECLISINLKSRNFYSLSQYEKIFCMLIASHTTETMELLDKHEGYLGIKFGTKLSKKILKYSKQFILRDPKKYNQILKHKALLRKLNKEEFLELCRAFYPPQKEDYNSEMRYGPPGMFFKNDEDKFNALVACYKTVYGDELLDTMENLSPNVIKLMPKEMRIKFVNDIISKSYEHHLKVEQWRCYLDSAISIPFFKEQIYISSDPKNRCKFLLYMVECCGINKDMKTFLEVLKYFNVRHRNEQKDTRNKFIKSINSHIELDKMEIHHWNELNEIFSILSVQNEFDSLYGCGQLFTKWIKFNFKNNLDVDYVLKYYIKWASSNMYSQDAWILFKEENLIWQKICIEKFAEFMPETIPRSVNYRYREMLWSINDWNKRNENEIITVMDYPWLVQEIEKEANDKLNNFYNSNEMIELLSNDPKAKEHFKQILLQKRKFDLMFIKKYIDEDPEFVIANIPLICEKTLSYDFISIALLLRSNKFKKMPEVEEAIYSTCIKAIREDDKNARSRAMRLLTLCFPLPTDEFFEIIEKYYPEQNRVRTGNLDAEQLLDYQSTIVYCLKYYRTCPKAFEAIRKFCIGDFLKYAVGSLTSICLNSPLKKTQVFLDSCLDTPVSFRKHIIRLQCLVGRKENVSKFLITMFENEKNPSIRHVLMKNILELFLHEPNEIYWKLCKDCIQSLNAKDPDAIEILFSFSNVSDKYLSKYIAVIWHVVEKLERELPDLSEKKRTLIQTIKNNVSLIDEDFIQNILKDYLFKLEDPAKIQSAVTHLAATYILNDDQEFIQKSRLDFAFKMLENHFNKNWYTAEKNYNGYAKYETRSQVRNFLGDIYYEIIRKNKTNAPTTFCLSYVQMEMIRIMKDPSLYIYDQFLSLKLLELFKKNLNIVEFGKHLRNLLDEEISRNGNYIIQEFSKVTLRFLSVMDMSNNINDIANGLLTEPLQSKNCALLVINLMKTEDIFKLANQSIFNSLIAAKDRNVDLILNAYY